MIYIEDMGCISPNHVDGESFENAIPNLQVGGRFIAQEPAYTGLIPSGQLRRMGKSVRMGVGMGLTLQQRNEPVEAVILATANGGLDDCLKFLNQIVEYKEGTLTPTNFVQSTPNAVAGNLALITQTTGYNITHVHEGIAFENAILDALMRFDAGDNSRLLLGAVDEISDYNYNIDLLRGGFKTEAVSAEDMLESGTPGTVAGEGTAWFVLAAEATERAKAAIMDVEATCYLPEADLLAWVDAFLQKNNLLPTQIDALVFGNNGDIRTDGLYTKVYEQRFPQLPLYVYKNRVGEYPTSSSYACWLATQLLIGCKLPTPWLNRGRAAEASPKYVLVYNHYLGCQHGLQLLQSV
ncbi:beta-ketoacyl synthase-like protein [Dyadobacter jejuensis]|uniref:Beta-ketoacyl synthase-like protein n=1 Tax=Dyadobacter jejuensis TaxID=1082580 RepID=A0A316AP22_9BACT|nr:beta-ketoacyl synthase chain length factor [Dyadobacter jejuensis]PWJ58550.1 beta-ketoacyl synthase-like protein [Dyadobacter jejuensis]